MSPLSIAGRKNLVVLKELYIGKILVNLASQVRKKVDDKLGQQEIVDYILHIYNELDNSKEKKYYNIIKEKLSTSLKSKQVYKDIVDNNFKFILMVEPFHNNISMNTIKSVAKFMNIPLDEKVYIHSLKMFTKNPVPVGIQFIQAMEQIAEEYESLRSTGQYKFTTGQPEKGKVNMGGQSLGNWDIYSLLTCEVPHVLQELLTSRSDDFKSKRQMTVDIIENGKASLPTDTGNATTKELYKIHMIAMGLTPI